MAGLRGAMDVVYQRDDPATRGQIMSRILVRHATRHVAKRSVALLQIKPDSRPRGSHQHMNAPVGRNLQLKGSQRRALSLPFPDGNAQLASNTVISHVGPW